MSDRDQKPFRYKCGLAVGDSIQLKGPLPAIRAGDTEPLFHYLPGMPWIVIEPSRDVATGLPDTSVLWLLMPDGKRHAWDDNPESVFEFFELVGEE